MAEAQGGQAIEMREQGIGLMDPRARSLSPRGPQAQTIPTPASAPVAATAPAPQGQSMPKEAVEEKSKKERKRLSKARPGSSGSEK
ncbi:hypothetical protein KCU90_g9657, partial [Aureobasidium melanogenum]